MNLSRYSYVFSEPDRPPVTNYPDIEAIARIKPGLAEIATYAIVGQFLLQVAHTAHLSAENQAALISKGNEVLGHVSGNKF